MRGFRCRHCGANLGRSYLPTTPCPKCGRLANEPKPGEVASVGDAVRLVAVAIAVVAGIAVAGIVVSMFV